MEKKKAIQILASILFLSSIYILLFFIEQDQFPFIFLTYTGAFIGFYGLIKYPLTLKGIIILALCARIITWFSFPALSDDIYRYIWDGIQWTHGNNPFAYLPSEQIQSTDFEKMLVRLMNSPDYHSIYPPVLQLIFYGVTDIIDAPLIKQVYLLKTSIIVIEAVGIIATILLLKKWKLPIHRLTLYVLNPLIIVELLGNIHFEVIMIAFLSIALCCLCYKRYVLGSLFLSLSILSKMTTLLVLPFFFKKMHFSTFIKVAIVTMLSVILAFTVMLWGSFEHFFESLNLYFQKFEFNASIYFVFRIIGKWLVGYNPIYAVGPFLSIFSGLIILCLAYFQKKNSNIQDSMTYILLGFTSYLLMSTTVHPWYLSTLIFLSIFTRYRFIQIWSYVVFLSYSLYFMEGEYYYWAIALEYAILGYFLCKELYQSKFIQSFKV